MENLINLAPISAGWIWLVLGLAVAGTYAWRGLGVLLSGRLSQDSPLFQWITCVTYAMVAALVVRMIVLPVGLLSEISLTQRLIATAIALGLMIKLKNGLVPALASGTLLIVAFSW